MRIRYEKSQSLLMLAFDMQGSAEGVSLRDIMQRFDVSRRTAERMRDAVMAVFPQVEEFDAGDGYKRWRIRSHRSIAPVPVSTDELATLHLAAQRLRLEGQDTQAQMLDQVATKLRSLLPTGRKPHMEPDLEALIEAEGLASRPGPRPKIDPTVLGQLREAIKGSSQVCLHYRARGSGKLSRFPVHPYGFLYGNRHYLVAYNPYPRTEGIRLYSLPNVVAVEVLADSFVRVAGFNIEQYAKQAFGVFQEDPFDVVWRVTPEAAADARDYVFHPGQSVEELPDGSLIIRFRAGGLLEMAWHLFTWEGRVQIIEPPELASVMKRELRRARAALPRSDEHTSQSEAGACA